MRTANFFLRVLAAAAMAHGAAHAVNLSADGKGQVLVYPFMTTREDASGNAWQTYLSVANHGNEAKALRIRVREGINGRETASFNLFLSAHDVWTGALIPSDATAGAPARILTADSSCIDPPIPAAGIALSNAAYSGANADGYPAGLERTREGFLEVIEMATFTPASATAIAVTHVNGIPPSGCAYVRNDADVLRDARAPTGGLSGTLTLINVNAGMDIAVNAVALGDLASAPFYRNYRDAYPGFSAAEVLPVSHLMANGRAYDLRWASGVDAVTSVFMSSVVSNEYILDTGTASRSDWVVTFPTRAYMPGSARPFVSATYHLLHEYFDRDGALRTEAPGENCSFAPTGAPCPPVEIRAAGAFPVAHRGAQATSLLGSQYGMRLGEVAGFTSGWMRLRVADGPGDFGRLRSEAGSTMTELSTGAATTGRFELRGLPWTGFAVRTFSNGTLACNTGACQGNYGGSFEHSYARSIELVAP